MSIVKCLSCASLDLQEHKKHAAEGLGRCPHDPVGVFVVIKTERTCAKFKEAGADIVAARMAWAGKL